MKDSGLLDKEEIVVVEEDAGEEPRR